MKEREAGNIDAAVVVKEAALSMPKRASKIREKCNKEAEIPYEPHEAVGYLINMDLSKRQYIYNRKSARQRNCNLYPSYEKVANAKKDCYPDGTISDAKLRFGYLMHQAFSSDSYSDLQTSGKGSL